MHPCTLLTPWFLFPPLSPCPTLSHSLSLLPSHPLSPCPSLSLFLPPLSCSSAFVLALPASLPFSLSRPPPGAAAPQLENGVQSACGSTAGRCCQLRPGKECTIAVCFTGSCWASRFWGTTDSGLPAGPVSCAGKHPHPALHSSARGRSQVAHSKWPTHGGG